MNPETNVNPNKDTDTTLAGDKTATESQTTVTLPEGFSQEEWDKSPVEWKDRFSKQSSSFQSKLNEKHEQYFKTEKMLVEKYPQRLQELIESNDPTSVKMAKRLSKEVYGKSLSDALKELHSALGDNPDAIKSFEQTQTKHELKVESYKDKFVSNHDLLQDKDVLSTFEQKFKLLKGDDILLSEDEVESLAEEAYLLATKGLKNNNLDKAQRKIAHTSGGGVGKDVTPKDNNPFAGLPVTR